MKVSIKKALATVMASALIVTSGQCPVASAAKKPALSSKKVTLKVGQKKTLKVKNKIKGSTYKWKSSKVKVAKVTKKGVVKAVKAGTATITCKVKTKATKKKKAKTYTLKCKVTVKSKKKPKPTAKPTAKPSAKPSDVPSDIPSSNPTQAPSDQPSVVPSTEPSTAPSTSPSASPSVSPSVSPSASPSVSPSVSPSATPSGGGGYYRPVSRPSATPTATPSGAPTTPDEGIVVETVADLKTKAEEATAATTITLKTAEKDAVIAAADCYNKIDLIVDSPEGHITNSAKFNSITIKQISETTWVEKAADNTINIDVAVNAHIVLADGANPAEINVSRPKDATARPEIKITVTGGTAKQINVTAVVKLDIVKDPNSKAPDKPIPVAVGIKDTTVSNTEQVDVSSAVQVTVGTSSTAKVSVELAPGAENSTVTVGEAAIDSTVSINNQTTSKIVVTKSDNTLQEIESNKTADIPVAATEQARLNAIAEALTWDKISDEEETKVTKKLKLPELASLGLAASVISGLSMTWTVEPESNAVLTNTGTVTRPSAGSNDVKVTLKATITGFSGITSGNKVFEVTILAEESAGSTKPAITALSAVSYTVATGTAVSGSAISGSDITVMKPTATVTDGDATKATFKYAVSDNKDGAPASFNDSTSLDVSDNTKTYYLWVEVTVGETTEKFWGQLDVASTGSKNVTMTKFVPSE